MSGAPPLPRGGSLPPGVEEDELLTAVGGVVRRRPSFAVQNNGIGRLGDSVVYDVHDLDGAPNASLTGLVDDLAPVLRPLLRPSTGLPPDLRTGDDWRGHLSLASHELLGQADLRAEVEAFVRQLDVPCPGRFRAATITVYRFLIPTWDGPWWATMRWERMVSVGFAPARPDSS